MLAKIKRMTHNLEVFLHIVDLDPIDHELGIGQQVFKAVRYTHHSLSNRFLDYNHQLDRVDLEWERVRLTLLEHLRRACTKTA